MSAARAVRLPALSLLVLMGLSTWKSAVSQVCPTQPNPPKIFGTFDSARASGIAGPMACSPDGTWAWIRESGEIARIDTSVENNFHSPPVGPTIPVRVGTQWLVPVQLELDPGATDPYTTYDATNNTVDILYLAAGRDGLWIMEADFSGAAPRVARVDDATGTNPLTQYQTSRRWCCDVDFATIGGTTYVVALFSEKDNNRLRFYPITSVRSRMSGGETGSEIGASLEVTFARHPSLPGYSPATDRVAPSASAWPWIRRLPEQMSTLRSASTDSPGYG